MVLSVPRAENMNHNGPQPWCPYGVHNHAKTGENDGKYYRPEMEVKYKEKRGLASAFIHLPNPLRTDPETDVVLPLLSVWVPLG